MDLNDIAGIATLAETFPSLKPYINSMGFTRTTYTPQELPSSLSNMIMGDKSLDKNPLYGLPRSSTPQDLPESIKSYRADPSGKYGGKEGLETLPLQRFEVGGHKLYKQPTDKNPDTSTPYSDSSKAIQTLYRYARANGAAEAAGHPSLSPEELAAMALKEGRFDYGMSGGSSNKFAYNYYLDLKNKYNITPSEMQFLSTIADKKRIAEKFNIPFAKAWNGTGTNEVGQTGEQYAADMQNHLKAATNPKNKELLNLIQRAIDDGKKYGFPLKANNDKDTTAQKKLVPYKKGGSIAKPLAGGNKTI
jgi:hypothetical protein